MYIYKKNAKINIEIISETTETETLKNTLFPCPPSSLQSPLRECRVSLVAAKALQGTNKICFLQFIPLFSLSIQFFFVLLQMASLTSLRIGER